MCTHSLRRRAIIQIRCALARICISGYACIFGAVAYTMMGAMLLDALGLDRHSELGHAAAANDRQWVQQLLYEGAQPDAGRENGVLGTISRETPLASATMRGAEQTAKMLLDADADPNAGTAIGPAGCITRMVPLHYSANRGDSAVVGALLKAGADPNLGNTVGFGLVLSATPLLRAAEAGHAEVVDLLLAESVQPTSGLQIGPFGIFGAMTPQQAAESNGHHAIAKRIAAAEAENNTKRTWSVAGGLGPCLFGIVSAVIFLVACPVPRLLVAVILVMTAGLLMLAPALSWYGFSQFIPPANQRLDVSAGPGWAKVLSNRTVVFIGGPHRAGTTLLWQLLRTHPDILGFGYGPDYSEGVFLQDVLPTFGVGKEWLYTPQRRENHEAEGVFGIGTYALGSSERVHLTETNPPGRVSPAMQARLLNRWGYHWQLAAAEDGYHGFDQLPIWLEKSPTDAVCARFLQAIINLGIDTEQATKTANLPRDQDKQLARPQCRRSRAKFLFINRHPLAVALSTQLVIPHPLPLRTLLRNWLAINKYIRADAPFLVHSLHLKLEQLASRPHQELRRIWTFLAIRQQQLRHSATLQANINPNPNSVHERAYCQLLRESVEARQKHAELVTEFGLAVEEFGYRLDEWQCVSAALRL